jgi:hypothetical protein
VPVLNPKRSKISSIRQEIYEEWRQLVKREKLRRYGWMWVAIGLAILFAVILM